MNSAGRYLPTFKRICRDRHAALRLNREILSTVQGCVEGGEGGDESALYLNMEILSSVQRCVEGGEGGEGHSSRTCVHRCARVRIPAYAYAYTVTTLTTLTKGK